MYSAKNKAAIAFYPSMVLPLCLSVALIIAVTAADALEANDTPRLGKVIEDDQVKFIDISIDPEGKNLPSGGGSAIQGEAIYAANCASCHGVDAKGGEGMADPLIGGTGTLASDAPMKTVISFWPYATTLFDYTRRAMPLNAPMSLSDDEVYAVSAYLLNLGGVIEKDFELNADTLPTVKMPNSEGFQSVWQTE